MKIVNTKNIIYFVSLVSDSKKVYSFFKLSTISSLYLKTKLLFVGYVLQIKKKDKNFHMRTL